jgi:hypothetical protein
MPQRALSAVPVAAVGDADGPFRERRLALSEINEAMQPAG